MDESPAGNPDHETAADVKAESVLLERAIGGWRGIIDSGLPTVVFVVAYLVMSAQPVERAVAVSAAIAAATGAVIAVVRLVRREPLQQVLAGFAGLAISAFFAWRTGRAENFFLPGLLTNIAYGTAFLIGNLVTWPLLGIAMGYLTGERTAWRQDQRLRRTYAAASWLWVGVFYFRVVVQVPLYLAHAVTALGIVKVLMGWPLFLAGAYVTYRVLAPVFEERRALAARKAAGPQE